MRTAEVYVGGHFAGLLTESDTKRYSFEYLIPHNQISRKKIVG